MVSRDVGVHDQALLLGFVQSHINRLDQVSFVGAVCKSLAYFQVAQDWVRRGERFAFNLNHLCDHHFLSYHHGFGRLSSRGSGGGGASRKDHAGYNQQAQGKRKAILIHGNSPHYKSFNLDDQLYLPSYRIPSAPPPFIKKRNLFSMSNKLKISRFLLNGYG